MCGACRVTVGDSTKFVCVDGPEFDGHKVDFDEMMKRLRAYVRTRRRRCTNRTQERAVQVRRLRRPRGIERWQRKPNHDERRPDPAGRDAPAGSAGAHPQLERGAARLRRSSPRGTRCLQCKNPVRQGLSGRVQIPAFIELLRRASSSRRPGRSRRRTPSPPCAAASARRKSSARSTCVVGKKGEAVAIGRLERFAADCEMAPGRVEVPGCRRRRERRSPSSARVPRGSPSAGDLVRSGHDVTIFEALHKPGGVLIYGIPEFRLPKGIVSARSRTSRRWA